MDVSRVGCKQRERERAEKGDGGGRGGVKERVLKSTLRVIRKKRRPYNVICSWDPLMGWGEGQCNRGLGFNGSTIAFL